MSDIDIRADIIKALDNHKIKKVVDQMAATILVGFKSGRVHVDTVHEIDENGQRRTTTKAGQETSDLAKELSYGSSRTPARPFLVEGMQAHKEELAEAIADELSKQINFSGGLANWDKVGVKAVAAIKDFVYSDYYKSTKPNSPEWIKEKGSDRPLLDGADLISDLSYVVQKKEEK